MQNFLRIVLVAVLAVLPLEKALADCQSEASTPYQENQDTESEDGEKSKEQGKRLGPVARRLARVNGLLERRYEATGETRQCLRSRMVRNTSALSDDAIMFKMIGRKAYVATMSNTCSNLAREDRFIYTTTDASICRGQILTIIDSFGRPFNSCSISRFEEYRRKPETQTAEE